MNQKNKSLFVLVIGLLIGALGMYLFKTYKIEKIDSDHTTTYTTTSENSKVNSNNFESKNVDNKVSGNSEIERLTEETKVIDYVKSHHELPDYYITKSEAKKQGWNPSQGNLCDVLPGRAIGGDHFSNREKKFPNGEQYFEADVNYNCGNRNADRIVFTKNGDVWLTHDHYKSFEKQ